MLTISKDPIIRFEEQNTLKWFLVLFFIISIGYDLIYGLLVPILSPKMTVDLNSIFGLWIYLFLFGLIPFVFHLIKQKKQYVIKYMYFLTYILLVIINESIYYTIHPKIAYHGGNIVEVFWLLLSPIFVSRRFCWLVSGGLIFKYAIVGLIIHSSIAFFPMILMALFSIPSLILLNRFNRYVKAVKTSYDQQLVGIVKGVIATLELKDPYTRGHSERVASYALVLAKEMRQFTEEELESFNYACLLHDIGKINIPDQILMKPGKLTNEEYEIIKTHPVVGAEAIPKVSGLQRNIDVIRSHHERWDGLGYPDQLKGEEIPFLARVTALADAFDAMTSSRSYRAALCVKEAYRRILEGKGTQFDPEIVNAFQRVYPTWVSIHDEVNENTNSQFIDII